MTQPPPQPGSLWRTITCSTVRPENEFNNDKLPRSRLLVKGVLVVFLGSIRRPTPPPGPSNSLTWIRILFTDGSTALTIGEDWWNNFEPVQPPPEQ